jgi:cbb3-type cytochrome oxidase subunit 3
MFEEDIQFVNLIETTSRADSSYFLIPWSVIGLYYIWCGFRTISLVKSVMWYTEYLMYFFHCEETRLLVSIFTYIDSMFLFLRILTLCFYFYVYWHYVTKFRSASSSADENKFVNLSVLKNFIKFQSFQKISKFFFFFFLF